MASGNELRPYISRRADLASGATSPRKFLEECIERIEAREPQVQAFVSMDVERARKLADASGERWRAGRALSPYDGMPIGVKDIIETEDFPTEMGSPLFVGWRSGRDAAVVKALRAAGAVIVGKTVTTEFAAAHPGKTHNPWDLRRTPGGSSSGSAAAVAAGFLPAALGTQVVGSILRPSSFCGVFGYKPSLGGINRGGSHDFLSQSCTGVLAASVEDAWVLARDLSGRAGGDPGFPGIAGPEALPAPILPTSVILLETAGWNEASDAARQALADGRDRLERAGVKVVDRKTSSLVEEVEKAIEACFILTRRINAFEGRWPYNVYRDMDASKLSPGAAERIVQAFELTPDDYRRDLAQRDQIRTTYARLAEIADCCIMLPATGPAPMGLASTGNSAFVVSGSLLGVPGWNLPVFAIDGLPLGLQVLGFLNQDAELAARAGGILATLGMAELRMAG
ncbi:amidase [Roseiarcaceae bacterium H3SJ34-1]|uniref:amidase n=1 Tax=Terripilifer ovatus TaxID=3032367 RepID=UPI003AB98AF4|nr:amidase [Roseiarcaceae bacterium H3SJ34-1]